VGTTVPHRVTLLRWGRGLGIDLRLLLAQEHQLQVIGSPLELTEGGLPADVVVVDVPAKYRRVACAQVRRHYRGQLLVLLDPEDSSQDLPPDPNRTLLTRPFGVAELLAALAGSAPVQPAGDPRLVLPRRGQVRGVDPSLRTGPGTVAEVVPWLVQSWRERRPMRVATISVAAVLAFTVAFVLVTRGAGCGPACDELTGGDLAAPSSTLVTGVAAGPATTGSGAGMVGPTTTDPSSTAAAGGTLAAAATSSARTTAGSSNVSSSTSPPDPPRTTPLTTAPPTTAPPTTATTTTTTDPPHTTPPHPTKP
jgi:hypothetical protein